MRTNLHKTAAIAAVLASIAATAPVTFAQISVQGSMNTNTTVGTTATGAANTSVQANVNANSSTSANTSATTGIKATVSGGTDEAASADVDAQVTQTLQASDPNVAEVTSDDDSVTVEYKVPGHFLGFIPVHTTAYVTTDASGKTEVHYPWYTFATSVNDESLKADLEARNWAVTSSNKAEVATSIQSALKTWVSTDATADTSVDK